MKRRTAIKTLFATLMLTQVSTLSARAQKNTKQAPLFKGLGNHHHGVTTNSELAQRYFDQGLIWAFAFNHAEAHRSFLQAAQLDPNCAMAWWGAAWVLGPNINGAMDPENIPEAWELLQKAKAKVEGVSDREKAYINALAARYRPEAVVDRSSLDRAFAEAMKDVATRYPNDLDAQVLYAEALMDTTPWDYWLAGGKPKAVTQTILNLLQGILQRAPNHPMANHLLIHAVEAAHPLQGLEEAKRLENLVPGAGHLVHMPSHIYIRLGLYHEATLANQRAIAADQNYLQQVDVQGVYRLAYRPHNYHFGWFTATLEGRSQLAMQLAQEMAAMVDRDEMRKLSLTTLQHYWITPLYTLVRFGHWNEILSWEEPAEDLIYPRSVWHYARGIAHTRKGNLDAAHKERNQLDYLREDPSLKWVTVWDINKSQHILEIASHSLAGEIAAAARDFPSAIQSLEQAVKQEDALKYDEPPTWHFPTRQALGAVLLEAGELQRAETIYQEDLVNFPNNGWSLFGLLAVFQRQGKTEEANEIQRRFREAWQYADIVLTASRF
ncbi:MAG: hypothetical protein GVY04_22780 [Cyanobacteria bacterium]|jgi:tetratricopeptide (TPR) repeat protein|nr:hypothetical protein [Cyanobacteria bacterium GSL.Bin1]